MKAYDFDGYEQREWEPDDIWLGPCLLLGAMDADEELQARSGLLFGNLPAGQVWLPKARATWYEQRNNYVRGFMALGWGLQLEHWQERNVS